MASSLQRRIIDHPLSPDSFLFNRFFAFFRFLVKLGISKPNTVMHYVARDDWMLLLTPLAGSSSLRVLLPDVKSHDLRKRARPPGCEANNVKICYVLSRDYDSRLSSFYNKKVRNPTSIGKVRLLATCTPLTWRTSPQEFVYWASTNVDEIEKDKHLYTSQQISTGFGFNPDHITTLNIAADAITIEQLLGVKISEKVNTSKSVSTFAKPLPLPPLSQR